MFFLLIFFKIIQSIYYVVYCCLITAKFNLFKIFVRRISMSEVPTDEEGSAKFVHKFYQEKDEIFDVYSKTGSFESLGVKRIDLPLNYYDLWIALTWSILFCSPMVYYMFILISNSSLYVNLIILSIFILGSYEI